MSKTEGHKTDTPEEMDSFFEIWYLSDRLLGSLFVSAIKGR